jgi:hypothetical protein
MEMQNAVDVSDVQERAQGIRQRAEHERQQWQDDQVAEDDRVAATLADKGLVISPAEVSRLADEGDWNVLLEALWAMKERISFTQDKLRDQALFFGPAAGKRFVWTIAEGLQRRG